MPGVWIDTDMGFDDLAAVLTVAAAPDWHIDGISLIAGNAPLSVVTDNALRAAACFGWAMPIHAGCSGPLSGELVTAQGILGADAMGSAGRHLPQARASQASADAVAAVAAYASGASEPVTLLALGPLTNVATLLLADRAIASRIGQVVWMGGSAGPGNHTAAAEFNAAVDPEAVQLVLDAGLRLRMVGLDACRQVRVHAADADALGSRGTERAALLADLLMGYVRIASPQGTLPMALYDPCAAAALIHPQAMSWRPAHMMMELVGQHTRGMTVLEWRVPRRAQANVEVASIANEPLVRELVLGALARAAGPDR